LLFELPGESGRADGRELDVSDDFHYPLHPFAQTEAFEKVVRIQIKPLIERGYYSAFHTSPLDMPSIDKEGPIVLDI
jgi:hypothetical protein